MSAPKKPNPDCPCTWPGCPRHGDCDACRAYHHGMGQKTTCEKQNRKEGCDLTHWGL